MILRLLIPLLILGLGAGLSWWLSQEEELPKPERSEPQRLKTEIIELKRRDFSIQLSSQGLVRAHHETTLTATVSGIIRDIRPCFEDGAFFQKGDILAEVDPADFQAAVQSARAALARAQAALAQEEARARQARLNWEDLGYADEPSELVLRVPQLKEARANVDAATATLDQARRDLTRTQIRAPFDGRVRDRLVGLGQAVGPSTPLGKIFATNFVEVRLPLTPEQLRFVSLPALATDPPVPVILTDALAPPSTDAAASHWPAQIVRTEGALDEASRELFAIARIDDPFGLEHPGRPALRIGQPVRAQIEGQTLEQVFVLPRQALRGVNRIYLVDKEESSIVRTSIEPIWTTASEIVVRDGLEVGQWLSITRMPYAPDGAPVEIIEAAQPMVDLPESSSDRDL